MPEERLYGTPGAEHLYDDLDSAADAADPYPYVDDEPIVLEEWTIRPVSGDTVNVGWLIDQAVEQASEEGDEWYAEAWEKAGQAPDVVAAFRAAADLMASKVGYRMADEHIATWHAFSDGNTWRFEKVDQ